MLAAIVRQALIICLIFCGIALLPFIGGRK